MYYPPSPHFYLFSKSYRLQICKGRRQTATVYSEIKENKAPQKPYDEEKPKSLLYILYLISSFSLAVFSFFGQTDKMIYKNVCRKKNVLLCVKAAVAKKFKLLFLTSTH